MNTSGIMQVLYLIFFLHTATKAQMTVEYDAVEDVRKDESCYQGNRIIPQESATCFQNADIEGLIDSSVRPILSLLQQIKTVVNVQGQGDQKLKVCLAQNMLHFGTSCYYFERGLEKNMTDSRNYCKQFYGADLVSVESSEERDFLVKHLTASPGSVGAFWLSLKNVPDNHTAWYWTSTNEMLHGFTNWSQGEPNHQVGEECVHMWDLRGYQWNDIPCDSLQNFICELML